MSAQSVLPELITPCNAHYHDADDENIYIYRYTPNGGSTCIHVVAAAPINRNLSDLNRAEKNMSMNPLLNLAAYPPYLLFLLLLFLLIISPTYLYLFAIPCKLQIYLLFQSNKQQECFKAQRKKKIENNNLA